MYNMVTQVTLTEVEIIFGILGTFCVILAFAYAGLKKWFVSTDDYAIDKHAMEDYIDDSIQQLSDRLVKEKADQVDLLEQEKKTAEIKRIVDETTRNVAELSFSIRSLERSDTNLATLFNEFKQEMNKKIDAMQEDISTLKECHHETQLQVGRIIAILDRNEDI